MDKQHFKLWYFQFRGRAEPIRLLLTCAGVKFEDYQFTMDQWPTIKPTLPGGRVPLLDVTGPDGKLRRYQESMAIARLLARQFKMMGETDEEYYLIERIIGECEDLYREVYTIFRTPQGEKEAKIKEFKENNGPTLLKLVSESLESSGGKHVAGNRITLGDLFLFTTLTHVMETVPGFLEQKFPKLHEFHKYLPTSCSRLSEYLKKRAKTPF
ncbi:Prostaglandin-H2 D-isomerase [Fasciola hepatica]|uniref:Prostaglandin-H2 D-isomerase n=1 Tax=Fasciola hepatica TaxID=6192 RepID=A0A4E0RQ92_FASHE|nr:Prostaglandin-H2 D-isomerase [Fasciola hepatica]